MAYTGPRLLGFGDATFSEADQDANSALTELDKGKWHIFLFVPERTKLSRNSSGKVCTMARLLGSRWKCLGLTLAGLVLQVCVREDWANNARR